MSKKWKRMRVFIKRGGEEYITVVDAKKPTQAVYRALETETGPAIATMQKNSVVGRRFADGRIEVTK